MLYFDIVLNSISHNENALSEINIFDSKLINRFELFIRTKYYLIIPNDFYRFAPFNFGQIIFIILSRVSINLTYTCQMYAKWRKNYLLAITEIHVKEKLCCAEFLIFTDLKCKTRSRGLFKTESEALLLAGAIFRIQDLVPFVYTRVSI